MRPLEQKIVSAEMLAELKQPGFTRVFTNGCFDILHHGHVRYLFAARELGDALIVGLNSDASVRAIKGDKRPIVPEQERAAVLAGLACVDYVVIFDESTPVELIKQIRPEIHAKGGDYDVPSLPETPHVRAGGGEVRILPFVDGISTTDIVSVIRERYC